MARRNPAKNEQLLSDADLRERLHRLVNLYVEQRALWTRKDLRSEESAAESWVKPGGVMMASIDYCLAEIEDYCGVGQLRIIWDQMAQRREREMAEKDKV